MTYTEVVHLLSSHLVAKDDSSPQQMIPVLEKFVHLDEQMAGFQAVDEQEAEFGQDINIVDSEERNEQESVEENSQNELERE